MNNIKAILSISLLTLAITSIANAQTNNINEQKSELRTQSSFIQLENTKLEREEANLNLQITIEQLRRELENIKNQEASDGTLTVEEYRDQIFTRGSSDEVRSRTGDSGIGNPSSTRRTATQLNQRDIQNRSLGGVQVIGQDGEMSGIDMEAINNLIQSAIDERLSEVNRTANSNEPPLFDLVNFFEETQAEINQPEQQRSENRERRSGRIPDNANVIIDEINILSVLERGNVKNARIEIDFEIELPNGNIDKIEDFNVLIEEGQIYTWYDKVYEVRSISVRNIILYNATDNEEIVTHL